MGIFFSFFKFYKKPEPNYKKLFPIIERGRYKLSIKTLIGFHLTELIRFENRLIFAPPLIVPLKQTLL